MTVTEGEIRFEVLGVGDTPNAHTDKHFPMLSDQYTLLRLIWTNRGEARNLQFKLMVKAMDKWNIEADMLLFNDLHQALSSLLMHSALHSLHSVTDLEGTECKRRGQCEVTSMQ